MPVRAAIALGSNLGDRQMHLDGAVAALERVGRVVAVSAYVETDPVGGPEGQGPYLNAVAVVDTDLVPRELLDACLAIEAENGRIRRERWGPRTLDLDILLYGDQTVDEPGLVIPHPEMSRRGFVLGPLAEVWPDARYPDGAPVVPRGRLVTHGGEEIPYIAVFLTTGLLAVGLWWLLDYLVF